MDVPNRDEMNKELSKHINEWKKVVNQDQPEGEGWLTVEEIMAHTGATNSSTVGGIISKLDKEGKVDRFKGRQNGSSKTWYRIKGIDKEA